MIAFKFDLSRQKDYYNLVKYKIKTQFYQNLHFYVLPTMPEKFRNRVVYFPEVCEPLKIYKKQKVNLDRLEIEWNKESKSFLRKAKKYFPELNKLNIIISPQFYGTMGSYEIDKNKIVVMPRYDRNIIALQKLIINALTGYYNINLDWSNKQKKVDSIQGEIFSKTKSMLNVLDTEFAGRLAVESTKYLEKLKLNSKIEITKPDNLTKNETEIFNLLLRNKNKLVSFDEISQWLWKENIEEKYSEYAITKLIERLRKKLPKNLIHSQRGIGYLIHI